MNRKLPNEFVFSLVSLALAIVIVHSVFVLHVRPVAEAIMTVDRERMLADPAYVSQRSIYIVIKDYEQEAEIILMLWALALMGYKALAQRIEQRALLDAPLKLPEGMKILPEDTREYARQIESLPPETRNLLVPRAVLAALARFGATRNVQDASSVAHSVCQSEAERLDSELSMLRYIAWAIPAIGFIGTVRGIGDALSQAHKAVTGDISGVTEGLGVAFNSTLIALLLSILLMLLLQQLQQLQERHVLDTETWLDQSVIRNLQARA
ncbi:MAG: MotA/TolQ/ExbB proton channel family protein [Steroidobacteraceae bacterium]|nr:MotA/TolQ/ExbB proton channel family protein [Nevskiaceae bacterium]MCP5339936.1 MotA/TolQ/ExbB proton channel family protein [Nevskiaceae bacterium]MCP5471025.1 MotA/TolQ/ExbB proton channel family protein [Nevskiaceae bacterium]